ncbi:hypothetical protein OFO30_27435, partial [Escherichia coli]|nr:hypothetical protein [Escherichia coli]
MDAPKYAVKQGELVFQIASSPRSATKEYPVQARANYSGEFEVLHNGKVVAKQTVTAGELFSQWLTLDSGANQMEVRFTAIGGPNKEKQAHRYSVDVVSLPDPMMLYVAPNGSDKGNG